MPDIQDILIDTFRKLLEQLTGFISNLIPAIFVLIVGIFTSKLIEKILQKGLEKAGVDKFGNKLIEIDIIKKMGEIKFSTFIPSVLYYIFFLYFRLFQAQF
jgi:hypothetical protein